MARGLGLSGEVVLAETLKIIFPADGIQLAGYVFLLIDRDTPYLIHLFRFFLLPKGLKKIP